jgi:hypothetical protein
MHAARCFSIFVAPLGKKMRKLHLMNDRFAPAPELFLPITAKRCDSLANGDGVDDFISTASHAEVASVLLLLNLVALRTKGASCAKIESIFKGVVEVGATTDEQAKRDFVELAKARFDAQAFAGGLALAEMSAISFLSDEEVRKKEYLTPSGLWDKDFCTRHQAKIRPPLRELTLKGGLTITLSDQQGRLFDDFRGGIDESLHLQAFAGAGKTFLISKFFELLKPETTLLMAYLPSQLEELKRRVRMPSNSDKLIGHTFGTMANMILNSDQSGNAWKISDRDRAKQSYMVSDAQIARWLGIVPVQSLQPREVAALCRRALFSYCGSGSRDIEAKHLPVVTARLSESDVAVLIEYTRRMWEETVSPSYPEIRLPVRNFHRIKYLALGEGHFPQRFTHIIVDESHELTPPMLQILDRSPQAVITLGDDYQHLKGIAPRRHNIVRQRNITQSVRSGPKMGSVLNPFIHKHPSAIKEDYEGCADHPTVVTHYDGMAPIPELPTTVIVANEWGLLQWFIRLEAAGANFFVPPMPMSELALMMKGLITLYSENRRVSHRMLFRYETWDDLANAMGRNHGFLEVLKWLEQGLTAEEFVHIQGAHAYDENATITLARVDDVKNREYDRVLVSRDLMRPPNTNSGHAVAGICCALYTAASRAKHQVIIPGDLSDWTSSLSS